ncbi:hypothetical protein ACQ4PT_017148 [Festuca glaucescens]
MVEDVSKMSNPCECCQTKLKFIRQINGNFMHSMVIPEWFVKYFGGKIPGTIKLETANGNIYDVAVTESMNRKILQSGWAVFVDANKIEENYSLMFRYLGNARFKVTIFDSNGKEKSLCGAGMKTASDVKRTNNRYVDNSSESRDGTTKSSSAEGTDSDGCPKESSCHYCESEKTAGLSYTSEAFSEDNPSVDESLEMDDLQMLSKDYVLSRQCDLTIEQEGKIHALIAQIQPKIPVLVVLMKKTNVEPSNLLVIRKDYALACFPRESQTITLHVARKSNDWQCNLHIRRDGGCNLRWGKFVRDNSVQEGDLCLFQPLTDVKESRFTVAVHLLHRANIGHSPSGKTGTVSNHRRRSTKISSTACVKEGPSTDGEDHGSYDNSKGASEPPFMLQDKTRLTQAQEKKVLEKVSAIESELPIYVVLMNKRSICRPYRSPYLSFTMRYVSRYLEKKYAAGHRAKSVISLVLQRDGKSRTWDTELRYRGACMMISKGWASFARMNSLREDDLCLFKVMENEEPLKMMVYIIRRENCVA